MEFTVLGVVMKYITSDLHFGHKNILKFNPDTRPFNDIQHMEDELVHEINSLDNCEMLYHLGDLFFGKPAHLSKILERINQPMTFLRGNHCEKRMWEVCKEWSEGRAYEYKEIRHQGHKIILFHFPIAHWNQKEKGAIHLFGHCMSLDHEILTTDGWITHDEMTTNHEVYSVNKDTGKGEVSPVTDIVKYNYTGNMIHCDNEYHKFDLTTDHTFVGKMTKTSKVITEIDGNGFLKRGEFSFFKSTEINNGSLPMTDDMVRLYVFCTADGSFKKETLLWRIRVMKPHKKEYIEKLLQRIGISYNSYEDEECEYTSYNFYQPYDLKNYMVKGLDTKLLGMSKSQFKAFLDAYSMSDGNRTKSGGTMIYTSKRCEMDLISHLCIINGYSCSILTRTRHGFSKGDSYEISIAEESTVRLTNIGKHCEQYPVVEEPVWCIKTQNQNFFTRYKGKIHLTGNCHGSYQTRNKSIDVGYDAFGHIMTLDEAIEIADVGEIEGRMR